MTIKFFVAGLPKSMKVGGVARFVRGGKMHMVPKRGNEEWVTLVGRLGREVMPPAPLDGAVAFTATFYMPRPASAKKVQFPLKRPDLDNLVHKMTDQFNGVFWRDDSQIIDVHARKRFATERGDGRAGVEIVVHPVSERPLRQEVMAMEKPQDDKPADEQTEKPAEEKQPEA